MYRRYRCGCRVRSACSEPAMNARQIKSRQRSHSVQDVICLRRRPGSSSCNFPMEVRMKKILLAGTAALVLAGSTAVYAQHRPWFHDHMRMSAEDRAAFADARIAAIHAGLKLTADQEK